MIQLNSKVNWGKAQMKRTEWYSGDQKPVRKGVYERDYRTRNTFYCYWDGAAFGCSELSPDDAISVETKSIGALFASCSQYGPADPSPGFKHFEPPGSIDRAPKSARAEACGNDFGPGPLFIATHWQSII